MTIKIILIYLYIGHDFFPENFSKASKHFRWKVWEQLSKTWLWVPNTSLQITHGSL